MSVAGATPVEVARVGQHGDVLGTLGIADGVAALHLVGKHLQANALDAAGGAGEGDAYDVVGQPDRFENLRALIRLQRRDPHFRHDLEHAFGRALAVGGDHVVVGGDVRRIVQVAVAAGLPQ